jgi:hypothetical protein
MGSSLLSQNPLDYKRVVVEWTRRRCCFFFFLLMEQDSFVFDCIAAVTSSKDEFSVAHGLQFVG